jgi:hypothetical protein
MKITIDTETGIITVPPYKLTGKTIKMLAKLLPADLDNYTIREESVYTGYAPLDNDGKIPPAYIPQYPYPGDTIGAPWWQTYYSTGGHQAKQDMFTVQCKDNLYKTHDDILTKSNLADVLNEKNWGAKGKPFDEMMKEHLAKEAKINNEFVGPTKL